jgi:AcrR family transcriptional regulator
MPQAPDGLRERKKQRTRETIVRAALELFHERGFEATTIADIAAAADIAPRTFFGYFPSKEAVAFHDFEEVFARFAERLRARPASETAFDAMRDWIAARVAEAGLHSDEERRRRRLVRTTPALRAHDRANLARFEVLLAEAVAADLGVAPDSLRPHLVSAAAMAALESLDRFDDQSAARSGEQVVAAMDEALVFLRGGLDALRRHPPI